ncbi:hypothetical protein [Streptomyces fradiae]|uniref:hypothetical protein n=1 Tax=Streptomyces fradiae TaxID=1906 RepID=UPI003986AE6F
MTPRTHPERRPNAKPIRRGARLPRPGRAWIVPVAALAGALAGGAYGLLAPARYAATSYVVVVPEEGSDPAGAMGLAQAYGRVATDVALAGDAAVWARVSPAVLKAGVAAATSPDAPMISITARSGKPSTAAAMADGVARALVEKGTHAEKSTHVKVVQFSRATTPTSPASPSAPLAALVGAAGGGLLGGLALLVRPRRGAAEADVEGTEEAEGGASACPGASAGPGATAGPGGAVAPGGVGAPGGAGKPAADDHRAAEPAERAGAGTDGSSVGEAAPEEAADAGGTAEGAADAGGAPEPSSGTGRAAGEAAGTGEAANGAPGDGKRGAAVPGPAVGDASQAGAV